MRLIDTLLLNQVLPQTVWCNSARYGRFCIAVSIFTEILFRNLHGLINLAKYLADVGVNN
jgi:hypothetical protein